MTVAVEQIDPETFQVTVTSDGTTVHTVKVPSGYGRKLTGGRTSTARLVEKSFEFLLERESNTSILRTFELSVIERYFPGYEKVIQSVL